MMGNEMQWQAIPLIAELLGVEDLDAFVADLVTIRGYGQKIMEAQRRG